MQIKIKAPMLPESVADGTVVKWHKNVGERVCRDDALVDIETEKVVLEVPAPEDGVLQEILKHDGSTIISDEDIAVIDTIAAIVAASNNEDIEADVNAGSTQSQTADIPETENQTEQRLSPAARHMVKDHNIDPGQIDGSGKDGRITKQDVLAQLEEKAPVEPESSTAVPTIVTNDRPERREPMSRLRATIADRLVQAQHNAALLTTFNEINMHGVMELRRQYKQEFEQKHGVKLGLMSFFVTAVSHALQKFPVINASVEGSDIIYHDYYDIGIAVSSPRGLVVPVLRNANELGFSEIETAIADFGVRARQASLTMADLTGGTFTITNGGVFGSLLSTPIVNPPQSAILAMHKTQDRPVAENGEVIIRPLMNIALGYDHRIIDGRDAVQFLVSIKEALEDPARLILDI